MTKQILAFLFCFTRELNPYSPPYPPPTHPSATNPQPFCLPGDDCRTYGRLTDPKKPTLKIPPSKAWCSLHSANATSPRAAHCIANSSQHIGPRLVVGARIVCDARAGCIRAVRCAVQDAMRGPMCCELVAMQCAARCADCEAKQKS
jgi:hypothetical protein